MTRLLGNVVALMAILLGGAALADAALARLGSPPHLLCDVIPFVDLVLGRATMYVVFCVGLGFWLVTGFRTSPGVPIMAAAFAFGLAPGFMAAALNPSCPFLRGTVEQRSPKKNERFALTPGGLSAPRTPRGYFHQE